MHVGLYNKLVTRLSLTIVRENAHESVVLPVAPSAAVSDRRSSSVTALQMLRLPAKSRTPRRLFYGFLVGEAFMFLACFYGFRRLLYDRDARLYCRDHYPYILKQFYWVLSLDKNPASNTLHLVDEEIWKNRK